LRPTLAGQANAKVFLSSSTMGKTDAHAVAFDAGDTALQMTAAAETWVARPELTQQMCLELEPDDDTFWREYGIRPFDGSVSGICSEAQLLAVTRRGPVTLPRDRALTYFAAEDPANRGGNAWTVLVGYGRQEADDVFAVIVADAREWRAPRGGALDSDATYFEMASWLAEWGVRELWTDPWSFDSRAALARRHGLDLLLETATQAGNVARAEAFRRRMADRLIELPDIAALRSDVLGVRKWISRNGAFSIELERVGGRHCDWAPALFLLCDKVFAADAQMPGWARPGFAENAPALFGSFEPQALYPRRELKSAPIKFFRLPNGDLEATGNAPPFSREMTARWRRGQEARFSSACTTQFQNAIARHRAESDT
jgi:hypothetical protein